MRQNDGFGGKQNGSQGRMRMLWTTMKQRPHR